MGSQATLIIINILKSYFG